MALSVLIGCEESGVIRRRARAIGADAWSNDLHYDARDGSSFHLKMDVEEAMLSRTWDIIILHLPCTALSMAGNSTYGYGMRKHKERIEAAAWSNHIWHLAKSLATIGVGLENPRSMIWQYIDAKPVFLQPYQVGHLEMKLTGWATYKLPPLKAVTDLKAETMALPRNVRERLHYLPPSPTRAQQRSETYPGFGDAVVDQWIRPFLEQAE